MSVLRKQNWLGQQRVDIPHLRAIESSICADFDVLAGRIMSGGMAVIVSGFDTITSGAVGQPATSLQVNTANAVVMHTNATDSGTIFQVPSTRAVEVLNAVNTRVNGGFTSSSTNYIGIDLLRSADSTTADLVQFINPVTNLETPKDVPLGITMDYVISISTQDFSTTPGVCPIAIVTTDASNNVTAITDARNLVFRLGSGGSNPNTKFSYSWPGGRTELGNNTDFAAGDKAIKSQYDWMNAMMSRVWELGGGEYWYAATGWQNVQLVRNSATVFVSTGDYFEWTGTNLHWRGLRAVFSNSTGSFNDIADQLIDSATLTDLADGQCIYVDIDFSANRTGGTALVAVKGTTATLGTPLIPGSRMVIAWRIGSLIFTRGNSYSIGATFVVATTSAVGVVKLHAASLTPATPVVVSDGDFNVANGVPQFDTNRTLTIGIPTGGANQTALSATGLGTGKGIQGVGGASGGGLAAGVIGIGGGSTGPGIIGNGANNAGVGSGIGGNFQGGTNTGTSSETLFSAAGIKATGPTTGYGCAIATVQSATGNIAAQQRAMRSDNYAGSTTDYLGFRSGWVVESLMHAAVPTRTGAGSTSANGWTSATTTNASAGYQVALAGGGAWAGGSIHTICNSSRTNADSSVIFGPSYYNATHDTVTFDPKGIFDTQVWVVELIFSITGGTIGTAPPASADFFIGWTSTTGATTPWNAANISVAGIRFKQSSGDTAWLAYCGDGTTQSTGALNTTPVMTIDTRHRLRLELHRANSPYGNCLRVFMDGVLTTRTTNFPVVNGLGGDLAFEIGVWSTGTVVSIAEITCGQIRINGYESLSGALTAGPTTSDV